MGCPFCGHAWKHARRKGHWITCGRCGSRFNDRRIINRMFGMTWHRRALAFILKPIGNVVLAIRVRRFRKKMMAERMRLGLDTKEVHHPWKDTSRSSS